MILCGAEGPAKGGSLFKMASAAAVASARPSGVVDGGRGGQSAHRTDGGAETQTKVSSPAMRE